jgi:mannose/fructose-specific phosphotransferase system component IIA
LTKFDKTIDFVMNEMSKMISAASGAVDFIFHPSVTDKILILTDNYSASIAEEFQKAFDEKKCPVESYVIKSEERPLIKIPEELE